MYAYADIPKGIHTKGHPYDGVVLSRDFLGFLETISIS